MGKSPTDWKLFALCANYNLVLSLDSLIAPLFATTATDMGVPLPIIGIVFVMYNVFGFALTPVVGHYLKVITRRRCIIIGLLVLLASLCLFGCAQMFDVWTFVWLSALGRSLMGVGEAMVVTASYAVLASDY